MCVSPKALKEWEYVSRRFEERFRMRKGSRIALYSGECLEAVMRTFDHIFHFHCILEPESTEVPEDVDLLILTNFRGVSETDYNCIHLSCEERGVPLYDLFGLELVGLHHELEGQEYLTISQWKKLLSDYEIVTLSVSWGAVDYHETMGRWLIRRRFLILYNWMISRGQTVYLFWDKEELLPILEAEQIDLSGKLIRRQGKNRGYLQLLEQCAGKKIIHIGTNTVIDGIVAREYGLDSRLIKYYALPEEISASDNGEPFFADREELIRAINRHEIISFDIFDTLLKRTVLHPKDVFEVVEERTGIKGFADMRDEIQTAFPQITIDEIYRRLEERCGYDHRTLETLRAVELKTESELILPRSSMVRIFDYAKARGKTLVLISDMYLDAGFIGELLEKSGITGYRALYLSCQFGMLKREGLFEELLRGGRDAGTILHIGDNDDSDYVSAREFGLDAFLVPSPLKLAEKNGYQAAVKECRTLADRKLLGLGIAMGFDDPFAQNTDTLIAGMIVAPLAAGYLQWVCGRLTGKHYDYFLLSSRDGYILRDAYDRMQRRFPDRLPQGRYFYTSRHAAFLTVMDDFELVKYFGNLSVNRDDVPTMFRRLFCLREDELQPYCGESVQEYYQIHEQQIHALAERFRDNYRRYLSREGLQDKKCAVMDFVSEGSSQLMLEKHITGKLDGFYIGIPEYSSRNARHIVYYLDQDLMDYHTEMKLEVYFTSPEPALNRIDRDGRPVFDEEIRDPKTLDRIRRIQEHIHNCLAAYLEHLYDPEDSISRDLIFELCKAVNYYDMDNLYYDDLSGQEIEKRT